MCAGDLRARIPQSLSDIERQKWLVLDDENTASHQRMIHSPIPAVLAVPPQNRRHVAKVQSIVNMVRNSTAAGSKRPASMRARGPSRRSTSAWEDYDGAPGPRLMLPGDVAAVRKGPPDKEKSAARGKAALCAFRVGCRGMASRRVATQTGAQRGGVLTPPNSKRSAEVRKKYRAALSTSFAANKFVKATPPPLDANPDALYGTGSGGGPDGERTTPTRCSSARPRCGSVSEPRARSALPHFASVRKIC